MKLIAAADQKWSIGKEGKLLTRIPADMQYFRKQTAGKVLIMGRKTLESFPNKQPLAGRAANIVLTTREDYAVDGAIIVHSVEEALAAVSSYNTDDVYVIGGGEIYRAFLPYCDTAYITRIDYTFDADTSIPDLDADPEWKMTAQSDEQTYFDLIYEFNEYHRI
ncbi:MAG: dihydrofolate reductase [Lachnospiraceae bacterium]|nr:dihydrofolate reductase [Lachnospiraceae bacterium]